MKQNSPLASILTLLVSLAIITLSVVVIWQRQYITDSLRASMYTPSTEIAALVEATRMSERGELVFYASQPELNGTQAFNERCGDSQTESMVLGCYVGGTIYVFDADNPEIASIEEVTAAHEMLHAAYERLRGDEKRQVDALLSAQAASLADSPEFTERIAPYRGLSDDDRLNELHSIFGTEYRDLPDELEAHYQIFFEERDMVVALYRDYADVFRQLRTQPNQLASQLDQLASSINQQSEQYRRDSTALGQRIEQFNQRAEQTGGFSSQAEFEAARNQLVNESNRLDAVYNQIQSSVDNYETKRREYDGVAAHLSELNNSIDSSLAPAPAVQ